MLLRSATAVPLDSPAPTRDRLQTAARELEAQFAQMMLKSMRKTGLGNELFGDNTMYRDMHDQQLSRELTKGDGLGLAPMIVRQLERSLPAPPAAPDRATPAGGGLIHAPPRALPLIQNLPLAMPLSAGRDAPATPSPATGALGLRATDAGVSLAAVATPAQPPVPATAQADPSETPLDCSSPEAFVRSIWPHARRTAEQLGVSAKALVAQAALETGWGRRLVGGDGSHNLFGIKAGGWNGRRVESATHEYVDGVRQGQRDSFRAYDSVQESFRDYARLMRSDRYAGALAAGTDADGFARGLQRAGYATDPSYAAKISAIVDGPTLQRALATLDDAGRVPAMPDGQPARVVAARGGAPDRG